MNLEDRFSSRHGFRRAEVPIQHRDSLPEGVRHHLIEAATDAGLQPSDVRSILCKLLRAVPDGQNWSEYPNIRNECDGLLGSAEWIQVLDFVELVARSLQPRPGTYHPRDSQDKLVTFEAEVNDIFHSMGVGWQLVSGRVESRGDDAAEVILRATRAALDTSGFNVASRELSEAIHDLSRRPDPDLSGAVHHAMAAVEAVAREKAGDDRLTLGDVIKRYPELFPSPLNDGVGKLWGFASNQARHAHEGRQLSESSARLVVGLSAAIVQHLLA